MKSQPQGRDPTFLVIGAGRCGTTTLCAILDRHPDVFISDPKEPGFFCNDKLYARGMSWYRRFFRDAGGKLAVGEGSVNNSKRHLCPDAAKRIATHLPDAKLLYIVRHPLEQIRSNWSYSFTIGAEERPFSRAVLEDPGYLATCDYEWQLAAFDEAYGGRSNILVLFMEDLRRDESLLAARVFQFLGLDAVKWASRPVHVNSIEDVRGRRRFARRLQQVRGYDALRRHVPKPLRRLWRTAWAVRKNAANQARWEVPALRAVLPVVQPRSEAFLRAHGKPSHHWDFSSYREIADGDRNQAGTRPSGVGLVQS